MLKHIKAEIDTSTDGFPKSYREQGVLINLSSRQHLILRHEKHEDEQKHSIYLFCKGSFSGEQAFIHLFPLENSNNEYLDELNFYRNQQCNFRLQGDEQKILSELRPKQIRDFECECFKTKDGRRRFRIIMTLKGSNSNLLIVYSKDDKKFESSHFFKYVTESLEIDDKINF